MSRLLPYEDDGGRQPCWHWGATWRQTRIDWVVNPVELRAYVLRPRTQRSVRVFVGYSEQSANRLGRSWFEERPDPPRSPLGGVPCC